MLSYISINIHLYLSFMSFLTLMIKPPPISYLTVCQTLNQYWETYIKLFFDDNFHSLLVNFY